ncbi:MAG: type III-A CRISPR-associated protein Cas10/Csm1, partial [Christensenellaceae bacterium]|nr:type III-A CRISPR-associated protein Cas10/Csm1 [Christensenellaceae bacterium]
MNQKLVNLIIGSLLHDVGKIIYRSGEKKSHSILGWEFLSKIPAFEGNTDIKECIKYHHGRELSKAALDDNSLAYIAYVADNISAYSDRRLELIEGDSDSEAGFDKTAPLASVFNILNGSNNNLNYKLKFLKDINYPTSNEISATASNYLDIKIKLEEQLKGVQVEEKYINSILHLLEICTSYVPSSTNTKELGDISLYDHSKTTASIASCLFYYLEGENLKEKIFKDEKALKDEKAFLLFSFDVSGIQNYIYTISGKGALKALRARSLYLDLLMENIVDDLLQKTNLSRCNLIYAGGGHAYILLPNTKATIDSLIEFEQELKSWFLSEFGVALYVACAYVDCTGNELAQDIGSVYERVGRELSIKKSQRYTYDDIVKLNTSTREKNDRECRECKKSGPLSQDGMCNICQALIDISPSIVQKGLYFVVEKNKSDYSLPLPFGNNLYFKTLN